MAISLPRKLWTVDEYERLIEEGTLIKYDRVELIRGEIVDMAPIGLRHISCVINLDALFHELLGKTVTVSVQNSVRLPNALGGKSLKSTQGHSITTNYEIRSPTFLLARD